MQTGKGCYANTKVLTNCLMRCAATFSGPEGLLFSIHPAHQWRFHFLLPSSLQTRRCLSVDFCCLNSSHNYPVLCVGQGWRPKQIFLSGKGFWHGSEKCSCYLDLKRILKILLRGWKKKSVLIKLKALPHFWKMRHVFALSSLYSRRWREGEIFKRAEIKRLVVFAEAMSAGCSDSLDCIYNIWPCAGL